MGEESDPPQCLSLPIGLKRYICILTDYSMFHQFWSQSPLEFSKGPGTRSYSLDPSVLTWTAWAQYDIDIFYSVTRKKESWFLVKINCIELLRSSRSWYVLEEFFSFPFRKLEVDHKCPGYILVECLDPHKAWHLLKNNMINLGFACEIFVHYVKKISIITNSMVSCFLRPLLMFLDLG